MAEVVNAKVELDGAAHLLSKLRRMKKSGTLKKSVSLEMSCVLSATMSALVPFARPYSLGWGRGMTVRWRWRATCGHKHPPTKITRHPSWYHNNSWLISTY